MCQHVSLQMAHFSKLLKTHVTFMRPFARMYKHVSLNISPLSKFLSTHMTFVWHWHITSMCEHVHLKIAK